MAPFPFYHGVIGCACGHCAICRLKRSLRIQRPVIGKPSRIANVAGSTMPQQIISHQNAHGPASMGHDWVKQAAGAHFLSNKELEYLDKIIGKSVASADVQIDAEHNEPGCEVSTRRGAVSGFYQFRRVPGTKLVLRMDTEAHKVLLGDFCFDSAARKSVEAQLDFSPLTCAGLHSQLQVRQNHDSTATSDSMSPKTTLSRPSIVEKSTGDNPSNITANPQESPALRPMCELLDGSIPDVELPVFLSTFTDEPAEMHGPYYRSNIELLWGSQPDVGYDQWDEIESPCSIVNVESLIGAALALELGLTRNAALVSIDMIELLTTTTVFPAGPHQASLSSCGTILPQRSGIKPAVAFGPMAWDTLDTSYRPSNQEVDSSNDNSRRTLPAPSKNLDSPQHSLQEPLLVRRGQFALRIGNPNKSAAIWNSISPAPHALAPVQRRRILTASIVVAEDVEASTDNWKEGTFLLDSEDE